MREHGKGTREKGFYYFLFNLHSKRVQDKVYPMDGGPPIAGCTLMCCGNFCDIWVDEILSQLYDVESLYARWKKAVGLGKRFKHHGHLLNKAFYSETQEPYAVKAFDEALLQYMRHAHQESGVLEKAN